MSRPIPLDPAAPVASLLAAAGVTPAELARRRGVTQPTVSDSISAGPRVSVAILLATAEACGMDLEIRVRRRGLSAGAELPE